MSNIDSFTVKTMTKRQKKKGTEIGKNLQKFCYLYLKVFFYRPGLISIFAQISINPTCVCVVLEAQLLYNYGIPYVRHKLEQLSQFCHLTNSEF